MTQFVFAVTVYPQASTFKSYVNESVIKPTKQKVRTSVCSWNGLVAKHFHLENYWYINCTTVYGLQVQEGHVWEDMKSSASTLATKVG